MKELHIKIPDEKIVFEKVGELYGNDVRDLAVIVNITKVENGSVYFTYSMFECEGPLYYKGNYRIKTDGSEIEKIGEGKFGDEVK